MNSETALDVDSLMCDLRAATYSFIEETEKSVWPVEVLVRGKTLILDWWLNPFRSKATHIKCWAGQVTTGKLIEELTTFLPLDAGTRLFESSRMMKSKFGIDPRSAWNSLGWVTHRMSINRIPPRFQLWNCLGQLGCRALVRK